MTLKTFDIKIDNKTESIEYEDDIKFGDLENILNKCLDMTEVNKPKVNIPLYRQLILTAVITKAPFKTGDVAEIRNLRSSIAKQIMKEVMKDYPLVKYLEEWVESFVGEDTLEQAQVSTTSSQGNSVGQNNK